MKEIRFVAGTRQQMKITIRSKTGDISMSDICISEILNCEITDVIELHRYTVILQEE